MSDLKGSECTSSSIPSLKSLTPIAISERLDAMDILRGLALIGILLMNIEWFNRAISGLGSQDTSLTGVDHIVGWLIRCFVEGKFYTLFSLLFGMGFAVMLTRANAAGRPFEAWFLRRMLVLIIFGILHMVFLWGGDILHSYGVAGLLLLAWMTLLKKENYKQYDNPQSFLKLAMTWMFVPIFILLFGGIGFGLSHDTQALTQQWSEEIKISERVKAINFIAEASNSPKSVSVINNKALETSSQLTHNADIIDESADAIDKAHIEQAAQEIVSQQQELEIDALAEVNAFTQESYWQATEFRLSFALNMMMLTLPFSFLMLMPILLMGYWLVSSGVMQNYRRYRSAFKVTAWLGISIGAVLEMSGLLVLQHPVAAQVMLFQTLGEGLFYIGQLVMTAGYFGLVMYLLTFEQWRRRLSVFSAMGRMALTNYISHSVILSSIFYGYAGGYFGEISRAPQMLIVLAIITGQLLFSRWWLNNYTFGPLEWLWRCLSYKKLYKLKKSY